MSYSIGRVQWEKAAPLLKNVREKVFICEWRMPKKIVFDNKDRHAVHLLVCDDVTQEPIGTGRLLATGEISRIAVLKAYRKENVDHIIMHGLLAIAKELNLNEVFIYSPLENIDYFRKFNFISAGAVFMEAGMPRQKMQCSINAIKSAKYYLSH
ncbi:GNAT family N-acetyltransferase [Thalassotalea castellviae]|uniref:GNAT family N-acetyltransferase n=1 Tax=Thalassotalea castellviae TaxID=3075612 RepID=A0ABU3A4W5_9GAMM|nr:GNAT family N-acetyltransferase [Thalassotalea sp. W431]MDT0605215.1 GNAT family N-acetyltransferase [Thalassotalea sp. W431]